MHLLDCIKGHHGAQARGHQGQPAGAKGAAAPPGARFTDVTCRAMTYHCIVNTENNLNLSKITQSTVAQMSRRIAHSAVFAQCALKAIWHHFTSPMTQVHNTG